MRIKPTQRFDIEYASLPKNLRNIADRKLSLFTQNFHHPSLCIKKMEGHASIWEGRITNTYRFTFYIQDGCCILRRIGTHDILKTP